jgi:hypothetical protein
MEDSNEGGAYPWIVEPQKKKYALLSHVSKEGMNPES